MYGNDGYENLIFHAKFDILMSSSIMCFNSNIIKIIKNVPITALFAHEFKIV